MIKRAIKRATEKAKERGWDTITIAVDWHDTICQSTYTVGAALDFYEGALMALRKLSAQKHIKLILFTSSYDSAIQEFLRRCEEYEIFFDYVNCNPDVPNTKYGDFSKKFYYDILVDDKAGFDPLTEWVDLMYVEI